MDGGEAGLGIAGDHARRLRRRPACDRSDRNVLPRRLLRLRRRTETLTRETARASRAIAMERNRAQ
ncbi:hypothetical protein BCEN4_1050040 [Burkholderia cenocepacia]|nr:hypothetical protein BCEN4_1050040 [Burkholderia cenocepacia]